MNAQSAANFITMQNILNCYVRETGKGKWFETSLLDNDMQMILRENNCQILLLIELEHQPATLYIPVKYRSLTGRHIFSRKMFYQIGELEIKELDFLSLVTMLTKELDDEVLNLSQVVLRVILSYENIKQFVTHRENDLVNCYKPNKSFLESEQSLLIGHQLHPTPKSRQGINFIEEQLFAPELKGEFQLHYFYAHYSIVEQKSELLVSTAQLIKQELINDPYVTENFIQKYCHSDEYVLLPIHPLQARVLLQDTEVNNLITDGKLSYLGPQGRVFYPTSSLRTVYHPKSKFMYKFSVPVKITNSLRVNKKMELERGVEVTKLLNKRLGKELKAQFPQFFIIKDPAFITIRLSNEESGFEVMLRENPFFEENLKSTTLVSSLTQDHILGENSQLKNIIEEAARKENKSKKLISRKWFKRYLDITLNPLIWLYTNYGIALEAHQQNSIIKLDDNGYPLAFYYRDNQGYYFMKSKEQKLKNILPTLNAFSNTVCSDSIGEERFRYYVFYNHLFGVINAFGTSDLIDEKELLELLRGRLEEFESVDFTNLISSLLKSDSLPCKANLLTRVHDMDELEGSLETQSIYVNVKNPLKLEQKVIV
jgi:siderophore synthetase component